MKNSTMSEEFSDDEIAEIFKEFAWVLTGMFQHARAKKRQKTSRNVTKNGRPGKSNSTASALNIKSTNPC